MSTDISSLVSLTNFTSIVILSKNWIVRSKNRNNVQIKHFRIEVKQV